MFYEIIKFYNKSSKLDDIDENLNLGTFLQKEKMSDFFINYHILPMVSAIWSMPPDNAKNMPIKFFLKFFQNHGLFKFKDRPQWYTVKNRSIEYVNKVIKKISGEHFKNYKINLNGKFLLNKIFPNKRGSDFVEFGGKIIGNSDKSTISINALEFDNMPLIVDIINKEHHLVISETNNTIFDAKNIHDKELKFQTNYVSDTTRKIIQDLLEKNDCQLPTIQNHEYIHSQLFSIFNQHLYKITGVKNTKCPIT